MASMKTSENRARLLAEVDEVLRATPVEVVLEAVRKAGGRASPTAAPEIGEARTAASEDAYFRHIFDGSALGIALVDATGRPLRCNRALERILGYEGGELGALAFPEITHPEDVALDTVLFQELLAGTRTHYQVEKRYRHKAGRTVSARLTVSLVPTESKHAIAMLEDITEEREARLLHAAALRALEGRVAELTAIHELSAVLGDQTRPIGETLDGVARALHGAAPEPKGSGVRLAFGDTLVEIGALADSVCTTAVAFGESGGRRGLLEMCRARTSTPPGAPEARAGERQLLETVARHLDAALDRRRADGRLALAVTAGKVAVWELDLRTGAITWPGQTSAALRAWPWGAAGSMGSFLQLVHPDDRALVDHEMRAAADEPARMGRYQAEYRIVPVGGPPQVILATGQTIYDDDGRPERMFGVAMDVTERRELERKLLGAQKMEAIGQLAGGVAHDFNNILCVILGYGQMVAEALGPAHASAAQVAQILKAGNTAATLTRQLLAFSRRQVLEPRALDLNGVVRGVEGMLRRLIREDVTLVLELVAAPAIVKVDPGQMEQVLMNLVVNARDAMPDGGKLTIRTALGPGAVPCARGAPPPAPSLGSCVTLSVVDTGTGMDTATQSHLFEPFFTTKAPGSGTGLGLSIVHGIVSQSQGQVDFESVLGEGTTFRIRLPRVATVPEVAVPASTDREAYRGGETVLLAEDQEPVRRLLCFWLERRGYRVLEAVDGQAGVELAAAHGQPIHLLLTDLVMPRAGGRELAGALWAERPTLPVIFMSGYANDPVPPSASPDPRVRRLEKPLSEATLLRAVREALDAAPRGI